MLKKSIIKAIRIYQAIAPTRIRNSCRFFPTCSEYMILAINKYGLINGIGKGFKRIYSCKAPNGGIDYP